MRLRELVDQVFRLADSHKNDEPTFIQSLLDELVGHGFRSARYYEVSADPAKENKQVLVLRAFAHIDSKLHFPVGYQVAYDTSTLSRGGANPEFVVSSPDESSAAAVKWIKDLHLTRDRWMDVPLRDVNDRLFALIGMSVPKEQGLFSSDDNQNLRILRKAIEQFQANHRVRQFTRALSEIGRAMRRSQGAPFGIDAVANLSSEVVRRLVGGQACAVFSYDWINRRLIKVSESFDDGARGPAMKIHEEYFAGQYLTGFAWENSRFLRIPDYPSFVGRRESLKCPENSVYHEQVLGPVQSVLYRRFGHGFSRFFVRVVNRSDSPSIPFNYVHEETLLAACDQLEEYVDDWSNRALIKQFEKLSSTGTRNIIDQEKVIAQCVSSLVEVGFSDPLVLYRHRDARFCELLHCADERLKPLAKKSMLEGDDDRFLARAVKSTGLRIWRLSDTRPARASSMFREGPRQQAVSYRPARAGAGCIHRAALDRARSDIRVGANRLYLHPRRRPAPRPEWCGPSLRIASKGGNSVCFFEEGDELCGNGHGSINAPLTPFEALDHHGAVARIDGVWRERTDFGYAGAGVRERPTERTRFGIGLIRCVEECLPFGRREVFALSGAIKKHVGIWTYLPAHESY